MRDEYGIPLAKDPRKGATRPRQLKDTCDMCSASKVKCDKRKPLCTRCERLDYPCFYSPARRLPKRRGSQPASSGGQCETTDQATLKEPSSERTSSRLYKSIPENNPALLKRDEIHGPAVSTNTFQPQFQGLQGAYSLAMETAMHGSPPRSGGERDYFDESVDLMKTFYPIMPANKPMMQAPQCTTQNDQHRRRSACCTCQQEEFPAFSTSSDCATAAVSILQNMSATTMPESPSHTCEPNNMMTATSIKRVSSMLICSCSEKADVGILVAAICIALLDRMEAIIGSKIHVSQSPPDSINGGGTGMRPRQNRKQFGNITAMKKTERLLPELNNNSDRCESHHCDHQRGKPSDVDNKEMIMQLVDKLPRVSNLVAQFTQRYSQERDPMRSGMMKTLISSVNCKLQMITDNVTSWVAQV